MKKSKLSAKALRGVLIFTIFLSMGLSVVGFYLAQDWLSNISIEISDTVGKSQSSGTDLQSLKKLQDELAKRQDIISKTNMLIAPSDTYQAQAIKDLTKYANSAGIGISNYSFAQPTAASSKASSQTKANTSSQPVVTLSLVSPVKYTGLLQLLNSIESNLPKMQVAGLSLGRVNGDNDSVRVDKLTVEVYTH